MYLASLLRQDGHHVALMDAEAEELDIQTVSLRMKPFEPDLLIGSVYVWNSYSSFNDIFWLKDRLQIPLVIRGHFPGDYPEETMKRPEVDVAMTGKGFSSIQPLVRALEKGDDLHDVKGILFRNNGEVIRTPKEEPIRDLDLVPFPARDLVDQRLYVTNLSCRRPFTTMLASRGCPFNCTYCTDRKVPYGRRSAENVHAELLECTEKYGIREVAFLDPTFTVKREWVLELCNRILQRNTDMSFTMRTRPDLLDPEMVKLLARAGCVRISLGIESGDSEILNLMNRETDIEGTEQAVSWIQREGIMAFGYFMIGNKGETHASLQRTLDLVKRLPLHFAQFFQTIPLLGTEVLENSKQHLGFDIWQETSHGRYPTPQEFRSYQTSLSFEELKSWSTRLYVHFYLHPRRWWYLLKLRFLPAYVARQLQVFVLILPLVILRWIRKRNPAFRSGVYPNVKNGGPGDIHETPVERRGADPAPAP